MANKLNFYLSLIMKRRKIKKIAINYLTTFITFFIVDYLIKTFIWNDLKISVFEIALVSCISFLDPFILTPVLNAINKNKKLQELNEKFKRK